MLHIILYAIVLIFVIMVLGYYSGKSGAFSGNEARVFNKLVLNYALPAALFVSIIKANRAMLAVDIKLTIVSFVVLMACFFLVLLCIQVPLQRHHFRSCHFGSYQRLSHNRLSRVRRAAAYFRHLCRCAVFVIAYRCHRG